MKHLIFDAGGVLVYPRLGEWHLPYRAAEILGPERAASLNTAAFRAARVACMPWLDEGRYVLDLDTERLLRRGFVLELDRRMGWDMTDDEIAAMTDDFTDNPDRYGLFDDVRPYLAAWKRDFGLGILSDVMPSLYPLFEHFGIFGLFDGIVISTHVGAAKPDPRMYAAILDRLGAAAGDCLFIDDRAANLRGAVAAGLRAVQMSRPEFPAAGLWDGPVVHSFAALDKLLKEGALE